MTSRTALLRHTFTTILSPSGDHHASTFSPCSKIDVGVLERSAKAAAGYASDRVTSDPEGARRPRTRTTHIATPFLVKRQKSDLRGLGTSATTFSGGILGRAGMDASCRAAAIGKYIVASAKSGGCVWISNVSQYVHRR